MSKAQDFLSLHRPGAPVILPNPWDAGSARMLAALGCRAVATTSAGFALTLGRKDYGVTREEALAHARDVVDAVDIPVSADLENGFGKRPEEAAETIRLAAKTGLAGGSIEDSTQDAARPVFELSLAVERVAAAVEAAREAADGFVLTARAEEMLYGSKDVDAVIARLKAFEEAGADVLYAPGLSDMEAVQAVCQALEKPVNVLVMGPLTKVSVDALASAGVARISLGGMLAYKAYTAALETALEVLSGRLEGLRSSKEAARTLQAALRSPG